MVERGEPRLSVLGNHGDDGFRGSRVSVRKVSAMAGHDDLHTPARFEEHVRQHPCRGRMKGTLRFLDAHQHRVSRLHAGPLVWRYEHSENLEGSVRHIVREESPRVGIAPHFLAKLDGQLGTDRLRLHAHRSRDGSSNGNSCLVTIVVAAGVRSRGCR